MEIISFVQGNRKSRKTRFLSDFNFRNFEFSRRASYKTLTYQPFVPTLKTFAPQRVKKTVSIKSIFKIIGSIVTNLFVILKKNIKTIVFSLSIVIIAMAVLFSILRIVDYKINFTNPLSQWGTFFTTTVM